MTWTTSHIGKPQQGVTDKMALIDNWHQMALINCGRQMAPDRADCAGQQQNVTLPENNHFFMLLVC